MFKILCISTQAEKLLYAGEGCISSSPPPALGPPLTTKSLKSRHCLTD